MLARQRSLESDELRFMTSNRVLDMSKMRDELGFRAEGKDGGGHEGARGHVPRGEGEAASGRKFTLSEDGFSMAIKIGRIEKYINEKLERKGALFFMVLDPVDYRTPDDGDDARAYPQWRTARTCCS